MINSAETNMPFIYTRRMPMSLAIMTTPLHREALKWGLRKQALRKVQLTQMKRDTYNTKKPMEAAKDNTYAIVRTTQIGSVCKHRLRLTSLAK